MIIIVGTHSPQRTHTQQAFERLGAQVHVCAPEDVHQSLEIFSDAAVLPTCLEGVRAVAGLDAQRIASSAALCAALCEENLGQIAQTEIGVPVYAGAEDEADAAGVRITLLTVRSIDPNTGELATWFCEPISHLDTELAAAGFGGWQPAHMSPAARDAARSIAARVCNHFGGSGLYSVELHIDGDNAAFVSVVPYATVRGDVTQISQRCTQYELLARAVLGYNIDPTLITPAAALQTAERCAPPSRQHVGQALTLAETTVQMHSVADDTAVWAGVLSSAETTSKAQECVHLAWVALHVSETDNAAAPSEDDATAQGD